MANSTTYFGFAIANTMFPEECTIVKKALTPETVREMAAAGVLTPCLNPSHAATINAMRQRFGIDVEIPETPPRVALSSGDSVVVMGVLGLPRLTDTHEYTDEQIAAAGFSFSVYTVE